MSAPWLVGLVLSGRLCAVIGTDHEAEKKVHQLLQSGASVVWFTNQISETVQSLADAQKIQWIDHFPSLEELRDFVVVVDARKNNSQTPVLYEHSKSVGGFWLLAIDQPQYCTLYGLATVSRGDLQIAVSTNGQVPAIAAVIKRALERSLGQDIGPWLTALAKFRRSLKKEQRKEILEELLKAFQWETSYKLFTIPMQLNGSDQEK